MVQITPMRSLQLGLPPIRALSSLTQRDAVAVHATVRAAARSHTVHEHDDYDGYLSLLMTPASDARASFMVSGRSGAVDVAELWGDEMMSLGRFASIGAAMAVLRPALEREEPAPGLKAMVDAAALVSRHGEDAELLAALQADADPTGRWAAVLRALDEQGRSS